MQKKTWLTILLSAVLFLSATVLGITSVFRVSDLTLELSTLSAEAEQEAEDLQKLLEKHYRSGSIFSAKNKRAKADFEKYPHFRMVSFQKKYPNRIAIKAIEDPEVYAVEKGDGTYYILGAEGTLLSTRQTPKNRSDGNDNVIVSGLHLLGDRGEVLSGKYFDSTLAFCSGIDECFSGIRQNVLSVDVSSTAPSGVELREEDVILTLRMHEGLSVRVYHPAYRPKEKAQAFCAFFAALEPLKKMSGTVHIPDTGAVFYEN